MFTSGLVLCKSKMLKGINPLGAKKTQLTVMCNLINVNIGRPTF